VNSRRALLATLSAAEDKVGDKRIRAVLPQAWRAGDKADAGDNGATNTIAILWPADRAIVVKAKLCDGAN
jgi:beta-lactamase class A